MIWPWLLGLVGVVLMLVALVLHGRDEYRRGVRRGMAFLQANENVPRLRSFDRRLGMPDHDAWREFLPDELKPLLPAMDRALAEENETQIERLLELTGMTREQLDALD